MELIFASNNAHKFEEIRQVLPSDIILKKLSDINFFDELPETGNTLNDNALQKARFLYERIGKACFADDSGLEVSALNGEPGVDSAHYAGPERSHSKNIQKVLNALNSKQNREACFKTVIALIIERKHYLFEGVINGRITEQPQGEQGFGYDPIFIPNGYSMTFAQMTAAEKNAISHRSVAVKKLVDFLEQYPKI